MHEERALIRGRDDELGAVTACLAKARSFEFAGLLLTGEPGIGKTVLLDHAAAMATDTGMTVVRCRGIESEIGLAFAGLSDLLRPMTTRLAALSEPQRAVLEATLALRDGVVVAPFAVGVALLTLLSHAAAENPVALLIDDVQWLDAPSLDALTFVFRRLHNDAVAVIVAQRDPFDRFVGPSAVQHHSIHGLDRQACGAMLHDLTGAPIPDPTAASLATATGGNPLALTEIVRACGPDGLEAFARGSASVPTTLGQLLAVRVDELPAPTREALAVVATSRSDRVEIINGALRALDLEPDALDPAESSGVISIVAGVLVFQHPLLRAVVAATVDPVRRRRIHRVLSRLVWGEERAWHLAGASEGPDREASDELHAAGQRILQLSGPAGAAEALDLAAQITPDHETRAARSAEAAIARLASGDPAAATRLLTVAESSEHGLVRGQATVVRAQMAALAGRSDEAVLLIHDGARELATARPELAALALNFGVFTCLTRMDQVRAFEFGDEALELLGDANPALHSLIAMGRAHAALLLGRADAVAPALAEFLEQRSWLDGPLLISGMAPTPMTAMVWTDVHEKVDEILSETITMARRLQAPNALPWPLAVRGLHLAWRGRFREADAALAESASLARHTGQDTILSFTLAQRAYAMAGLGEVEACHAMVSETRALAALTDHPTTVVYADHAEGLALLGAGRFEEAIRPLARCQQAQVDHDHRFVGAVRHHGDLIEAEITAGQIERAQETMRFVERAVASVPRPFGLGIAARCRALLAAPGTDPEAAFRDAVRHHGDAQLRFETGRDRLLLGEWLAAHGRTAEADAELERAQSEFERCDAQQWAARAAVGRSTPRRPSPRTANPLRELTPQQLQISLLVADGLSNREIADALFISVRTVESHLTSVFKRLGLSSRSQLTRVVLGG